MGVGFAAVAGAAAITDKAAPIREPHTTRVSARRRWNFRLATVDLHDHRSVRQAIDRAVAGAIDPRARHCPSGRRRKQATVLSVLRRYGGGGRGGGGGAAASLV